MALGASLINGLHLILLIEINMSINGFNMELAETICEVSQSSLLDPLLFLVYINDMHCTIKYCKVIVGRGVLTPPILPTPPPPFFTPFYQKDKRCQIYWGLTHVVFCWYSKLISHTQTQTQTHTHHTHTENTLRS